MTKTNKIRAHLDTAWPISNPTRPKLLAAEYHLTGCGHGHVDGEQVFVPVPVPVTGSGATVTPLQNWSPGGAGSVVGCQSFLQALVCLFIHSFPCVPDAKTVSTRVKRLLSRSTDSSCGETDDKPDEMCSWDVSWRWAPGRTRFQKEGPADTQQRGVSQRREGGLWGTLPSPDP